MSAPAGPRNAILIVADTLRADVLGCYGAPNGLTPNIDRLASHGVIFDQAITSGTWTQAAMPGILTSTFASMFNGCLGKLDPNRPAAVETLLTKGFSTGGFVSNPLIGRRFGYERGFSTFEDIQTTGHDPALRDRRGGQRLLRSPLFQAAAGLIGADLRPARVYPPGEQVVDAALAWLKKTETPFFGWLHFMDVHWPYHLDEDVQTAAQIAAAWRDLHHFHAAGWRGAAFTDADLNRYRTLYDRALYYLDAQIGRLIDQLEERNLFNDTVIVLTADHGEEFFEHGRWGHWEDNLHEEILNVPLVIGGGSLPAGRAAGAAQTLDIFPTLLDLFGVSALPGMLGHSLVPILADPGAERPARTTITEMQRKDWHKIAIRREGIKYIWDNRSPDAPVIYDLAADPMEEHPLSKDSLSNWAGFQQLVDDHLEMVNATAALSEDLIQNADADLLDRLRRLGYLA